MKKLFIIVLAICLIPISANALLVAGRRDVSPMGVTSLNTGSTYGANVLRAFLFNEGTGTTVKDYSTEEEDATLSNATWGDQGVTIDADNKYVYCVSPTTAEYTDSFAYFFVFRSTGESGAGNSEYAKLFVHDTADDDLQIYRYASDTSLRAQIDGQTLDFGTTTDIWDTYSHTVFITFDDDADANEACLYIDGVLEACDTSETFSIPTFVNTEPPDLLGIGNRAPGERPINGIVSLALGMTGKYDGDDAAALHAAPYQMFNNPPARTWYSEPAGPTYIETHYVTQSGAGAQDGTSEADAWPLYVVGTYTSGTHSSNAAADRKIGPGDRILYYGTLTGTINNAVSGVQGNRIYHDGTNATINSTGSAFVSTNFSYLTVQNFDFANTGDTTILLGSGSSNTAENVDITSCTFGTQTSGNFYIYADTNSYGTYVSGCTFPAYNGVQAWSYPLTYGSSYYVGFEEDEGFLPDGFFDMGNARGFDVNLNYSDNGYSTVEDYSSDSITARYGDQYWKLGTTIDDCGTIFDDAYKEYGTWEGWNGGSPSNIMHTNDGTEYWIGFSLWIPSDYYLERYHSGVFQLFDSTNGVQMIVKPLGPMIESRTVVGIIMSTIRQHPGQENSLSHGREIKGLG
jgi:hypothetical protein